LSFRFDSLKLSRWRAGGAAAPSAMAELEAEAQEGFRRAPTPKLGAYAGLAALGLLAALLFGLPELVALAAPFALLVGVGLALEEIPDVSISAELERDRAIEGDELTLILAVETFKPVEQVDLLLSLPDGIAIAEGDNPVAIRLGSKDRRELEYVLRATRWGAYSLGNVRSRAHDRFRLFRYEDRIECGQLLKVYPRPETMLGLLPPLETQVFTGNLVAREKGEGIEFADLRQFIPGDRVRRINWRASARRGELWVNELHAERNADVILFLDSFTEARREDEGTLDRTVRAASALIERYLKHKDRVGLVSFGGVLNWLLPATGLAQLYRIVDSLLDTEIVLNYAWKDIDVIPRRTLPPQALVIGLTPLLDERAAGALIDLRARGFDLAVVEVSPIPFVQPGPLEHEQLAFDIWKLRREALRGQYERAGVPVAVWTDDVPLVAALEEVRAFRRYARPVHA
jgi:uncharacterized protein (DUF58 family)